MVSAKATVLLLVALSAVLSVAAYKLPAGGTAHPKLEEKDIQDVPEEKVEKIDEEGIEPHNHEDSHTDHQYHKDEDSSKQEGKHEQQEINQEQEEEIEPHNHEDSHTDHQYHKDEERSKHEGKHEQQEIHQEQEVGSEQQGRNAEQHNHEDSHTDHQNHKDEHSRKHGGKHEQEEAHGEQNVGSENPGANHEQHNHNENPRSSNKHKENRGKVRDHQKKVDPQHGHEDCEDHDHQEDEQAVREEHRQEEVTQHSHGEGEHHDHKEEEQEEEKEEHDAVVEEQPEQAAAQTEEVTKSKVEASEGKNELDKEQQQEQQVEKAVVEQKKEGSKEEQHNEFEEVGSGEPERSKRDVDGQVLRPSGKDCLELYREGHTKSGMYQIAAGDKKFNAYCEQEEAGGGWLVLQHRHVKEVLVGRTSGLSFSRKWAEYKGGFAAGHELWLGLENLYRLLRSNNPPGGWHLHVDVQHSNLTRRSHQHAYERGDEIKLPRKLEFHSEFQNFSISSEKDGYRLQLGAFLHGDGGAGMLHCGGAKHTSVGMPFSTVDRDQDNYKRGNCATLTGGGWWFNRCGGTLLNSMKGMWFYYQHSEVKGEAIKEGESSAKNVSKNPKESKGKTCEDWAALSYLARSRMMIRPAKGMLKESVTSTAIEYKKEDDMPAQLVDEESSGTGMEAVEVKSPEVTDKPVFDDKQNAEGTAKP